MSNINQLEFDCICKLNSPNYNSAVQQLVSDSKYCTETDRTEGRIWWNVYGL